ncbi:MAG: twin-arginine translocase TatA/TatE family subunit [Melioribacteraceae bacterium]|nr:twin-arginine translocase TatA/TatE family subunit [Melioribacteraceae bacterium]MCF8264354.1 twin-arginine translocase TatA/TatE family subunit [Melioribacteraceae bacterium]MCF8413411.1 twin-arginine translocase TatA/TatE family subunit [Melioribacteraceae bacterium]
MGNLGPTEIILIVLAILVLFGAKKIPEFAKGLGKGMKEFKQAVKDTEDDIKQVEDEKPSQKAENKS